MKFLTLLLFFSNFCFGQLAKKDLFLIYKDEVGILVSKTENDSVYLESYRIISKKDNDSSLSLKVDAGGNLIKNIQIKSKQSKVIMISYSNLKNENNPELINKKEMQNTITIDELSDKIDFDDFFRIVPNYRNIYLVRENKDSAGFFIAKKVNLNKLASL